MRACEAPDCVLSFLPAHPEHRWCSPERCGNRVRVARYQRRHRA
ncbi:CGNR zinc finger domain-containing protein [Nocardiopsis sp. N85]|nr:CGNR zinc finger domain-containing protein [Nocardiopsis sp. N85]MDE3722094.1 CGNR zinc finger domain-containing protein [Nocardiopsis sp. N85]